VGQAANKDVEEASQRATEIHEAVREGTTERATAGAEGKSSSVVVEAAAGFSLV
jgi:hypothetical protein